MIFKLYGDRVELESENEADRMSVVYFCLGCGTITIHYPSAAFCLKAWERCGRKRDPNGHPLLIESPICRHCEPACSIPAAEGETLLGKVPKKYLTAKDKKLLWQSRSSRHILAERN